ncbi:hypothetical protein ASD10_11370 [Aeromicrobium sp. Root472D3]|nr:hypothetical protein ASD10_11370 [Aeromicrobium sp. Root472D3]
MSVGGSRLDLFEQVFWSSRVGGGVVIVDQLSSLADDLLTGTEVREVIVAVQRTRTALDATMSRLVGCADQMGLAKDDGAASTTAWLSAAAT